MSENLSDVSATLTPREQSLLELLKQGMSNKEIARTLGTSDLTVKKQMLYLFQKLGVHSRLEAVVQVMQAEINELQGWKDAVDHELVVSMECTADSFGTPRDAIKMLLDWQAGVTEYFLEQRLKDAQH